MRKSRGCALVLALAVGLVARNASGWERPLDGDESGWSVAVDAAGDILAAGYRRDPVTPAIVRGLVLKLSGLDGTEIWRREIAGTGDIAVLAGIAVDASGDAFVIGFVTNADRDVVVAKVAGVDGQIAWRHDYDGSAPVEPAAYQTDLGVGVGIGPDGHPIFAANLYNWIEETNFLALKLDSATGAEIWNHEVDGGAAGNELLLAFSVAPDGDAVLAGTLNRAGTDDDLGVVRLAGSDGAEKWRYARDGGTNSGSGGNEAAYAVGVGPGGEIVAAGALKHVGESSFDLAVAKLDGATGNELWVHSTPANGYEYLTRVAVDGTGGIVASGRAGVLGAVVLKLAVDGTPAWKVAIGGDAPWTLAFDPSGDTIVAGDFGAPTRFAILRLATGDGAEVWRFERGSGGATATTVDGAGRVVALGILHDGIGGSRGVALKLAPEMTGHALQVADYAPSPAKRALKLQSRQTGIAIASPGGPSDPTLVGATLELYNPVSGELATATLAAERWQVATSPTHGTAYRFKGAKTDPCQKITVASGKIEATCKGAGLGFSLDEATQGTLAVRLRHGALSYCATFGGTVQRDFGTLGVGKGAFKAKGAPAPASCPLP